MNLSRAFTKDDVSVPTSFKLPVKYALDGLHPDANGKQLMAERINAAWPQVKALADRMLMNYQNEY